MKSDFNFNIIMKYIFKNLSLLIDFFVTKMYINSRYSKCPLS